MAKLEARALHTERTPREGFGSIYALSPPRLREIAKFLFQLLDNIDTAGDIAKGDMATYSKIVEREHARRWEVSDSDGHTVTWKP